MKMIWRGENKFEDIDEKKPETLSIIEVGAEGVSPSELEAALAIEARPTLLINPVMVGLTLLLLVGALGIGWRNLAQEVMIDGSFLRLALLACIPLQVFVSLVCSFYILMCYSYTDFLVLHANHCYRRDADNWPNLSVDYEL
jgi:hypothetical protein